MTVVRPDAKVPVFSRIYRVPSYAQAAPGQAEGFETLAQVLGGDQTATLYRVLVEQKKLATDAGASYDGYARDAGEFSVYAVPRPGVSLETLEKAVDQVMQGFTARPAEASELDARQDAIDRRRSPIAATASSRMAIAYGQALMIGLTVDDVNEWPARIRAVNAGRCARRRRSGFCAAQRRHRLSGAGEPRNEIADPGRAVPCASGAGALSDCAGPDAGRRHQELSTWARMPKSGSAEDHTVPIIACSTSRCRRARPMIRPARRAWRPSPPSLIDEGAGNMDSKRLP